MSWCRCEWSEGSDLMILYHDEEWGVPLTDDRKLFEFIVLEGAQAGLSWLTVLRKRENYRRAFDDFDPEKVAMYDEVKISALLADPGIIRNRLKVRAAVSNAKAFLEISGEFGSFSNYMWQFVGGNPIRNRWTSMSEIPAASEISDSMSRELKKKGFKFVGSTICYSHMQAVGMVNDHVTGCFRYDEIDEMARSFNCQDSPGIRFRSG